MKKFIIHVSTEWCGMDQDYAAIAEEESDLWQKADELAYDNFASYDCTNYLAEDMFGEEYMESDAQQAEVNEAEPDYYSSSIEEVDENDEDQLEFFNNLELVYNGEKR